MNYDTSVFLAILFFNPRYYSLHTPCWYIASGGYSLRKRRVLHFGLVSSCRWRLGAIIFYAELLSHFVMSVAFPECSFLSCCKTLGSSSSVGYRFGTMFQRVRCPLFYIPSPSDVGIVFLLRLTTVLGIASKIYCVVEEHSTPEIV